METAPFAEIPMNNANWWADGALLWRRQSDRPWGITGYRQVSRTRRESEKRSREVSFAPTFPIEPSHWRPSGQGMTGRGFEVGKARGVRMGAFNGGIGSISVAKQCTPLTDRPRAGLMRDGRSLRPGKKMTVRQPMGLTGLMETINFSARPLVRCSIGSHRETLPTES